MIPDSGLQGINIIQCSITYLSVQEDLISMCNLPPCTTRLDFHVLPTSVYKKT